MSVSADSYRRNTILLWTAAVTLFVVFTLAKAAHLESRLPVDRAGDFLLIN